MHRRDRNHPPPRSRRHQCRSRQPGGTGSQARASLGHAADAGGLRCDWLPGSACRRPSQVGRRGRQPEVPASTSILLRLRGRLISNKAIIKGGLSIPEWMLKPPFFVSEIGRKRTMVLRKLLLETQEASLWYEFLGYRYMRVTSQSFFYCPLDFSLPMLKVPQDSRSEKSAAGEMQRGDSDHPKSASSFSDNTSFSSPEGVFDTECPIHQPNPAPVAKPIHPLAPPPAAPTFTPMRPPIKASSPLSFVAPRKAPIAAPKRAELRASASQLGPRKAPPKANALMQGMTGPIRPLAKPKPMTAPTAEPATTPLKGCWVMAPRIAKSPPQMIAPNSVAKN